LLLWRKIRTCTIASSLQSGSENKNPQKSNQDTQNGIKGFALFSETNDPWLILLLVLKASE
jgi:hypothetical protein